jgi:hypothetical protein
LLLRVRLKCPAFSSGFDSSCLSNFLKWAEPELFGLQTVEERLSIVGSEEETFRASNPGVLANIFLARAEMNNEDAEPCLDPRIRFYLGQRSRIGKRCRAAELERLISESLFEDDRMPGAAQLAKRLKVTPRTIRTYLKERREMLNGPEMYWLHLYAENEPVGPPELLAIEECAKRTGLSVREIRRKIWEERRDRIAKIREQYRSRDRSATATTN